MCTQSFGLLPGSSGCPMPLITEASSRNSCWMPGVSFWTTPNTVAASPREWLALSMQVGDERVEVVGIAGERVGQGLEVQGERRQVARGRVHVLAPPGGSLAQGVDHQVQLVADLGIEGVQNLVDFDRGQGVVLVDGAA